MPPNPPPLTLEKVGTWTKELEKMSNVPIPRKYSHSNVFACPCLPVKVYPEVIIFIWGNQLTGRTLRLLLNSARAWSVYYNETGYFESWVFVNAWSTKRRKSSHLYAIKIERLTKKQVSQSHFSLPFWLNSGLAPVSLQHRALDYKPHWDSFKVIPLK